MLPKGINNHTKSATKFLNMGLTPPPPSFWTMWKKNADLVEDGTPNEVICYPVTECLDWERPQCGHHTTIGKKRMFYTRVHIYMWRSVSQNCEYKRQDERTTIQTLLQNSCSELHWSHCSDLEQVLWQCVVWKWKSQLPGCLLFHSGRWDKIRRRTEQTSRTVQCQQDEQGIQ